MKQFRVNRAAGSWLATLAMFATLWLSIPDAAAESAEMWRITNMSGRVNIVRAGAAPVALTSGDILRPGDTIETAADSSAILVRHGESIAMAPNSRMGLPATNESGLATLIVQQLGTVLFKVERREQRHFEVKTPYLAAVVKGTTFTVSVDPAGAAVHVVKGAVEVTDRAGKAVLVRPGQTATASSAPGAGLTIEGDSANGPGLGGGATQTQIIDPASAQANVQAASAATAPVNDIAAAASAAAPAFVISAPVGTLDLDIGQATNGLIAAVPASGAAGAGQGKGGSTTTSLASIGGSGTPGGGAGSSGGKGGGSVAGGGMPGASSGSPVKAGQTGILPATASLVAQVTASPGGQSVLEKVKIKD